MALRKIMSEINTVTPTPVINSMSSLMSRLPMCAISCAITPSNSSLSRRFMMPRVRAIDASRGLRPVANAFNESSSMIYTRGVGRPAAKAMFSTLRNISRYSSVVSCISWAFDAPRIIASPNAQDISIHIAHAINVGIATDMVVEVAWAIDVKF